ncbi:MAG: hypothetical protein P4N41_04355 [Negativicutes bacterium]|nr:hypothetical protein [Negativicutes bacterium]
MSGSKQESDKINEIRETLEQIKTSVENQVDATELHIDLEAILRQFDQARSAQTQVDALVSRINGNN